jgi:hypothetical protein
MKKITTLGIGVTVIVLGAIGVRTAQAGSRATAANVVVHKNSDGSGYAYGAQGDARNSANGTGGQVIGCLSWEAPGSAALGCSATDPNGVSQSCWASSNFLFSMAYLMSAVTSDSYIYFSWDTTGACNGMQIINSSRYQPKKFFSTAP